MFPPAIVLTEPLVKIDFHMQSSVNRLWKDLFPLAPSTGGCEKHHRNVLTTATAKVLCTSGSGFD